MLKADLLKIQVNAEAEEVKSKETDDFKRGFDYACRLLSEYHVELNRLYLEELNRGDDELPER